jgi:predicted glycosyltransferase
MKILVAPLNWGLGHASRCVPLVRRLLDEGHEVVLGGDGESLTLLRKHFPKLRYTYLAPLNLRYSKGTRQVWAMLKALPLLLLWSIKDHAMLKAVLREEPFDQVISDNRFGLYINHQSSIVKSSIETVYITHQLHIMLPKGWRWAEGIVSRLHARIYTRFNKVWVPDYADPDRSLAGDLSHPAQMANGKWQLANITYIGPLSRFGNQSSNRQSSNRQSSNRQSYDIVAVLSGLEPHRTLLEQDILARYVNHKSQIINHKSEVLLVQGLMNRPNTRIKRGNITIVPYLRDEELVPALLGAKHIIARSGYSTLMDLDALGLLNDKSQIINHKLELLPTPGQPEQEYLAKRIEQKTLFS